MRPLAAQKIVDKMMQVFGTGDMRPLAAQKIVDKMMQVFGEAVWFLLQERSVVVGVRQPKSIDFY